MSDGLDVTIPAGDGAPDTPAFAMLPEGARRGVVVIHEIYGPRPEIDRVVGRFARAGYAAVAPDLFARGKFACLREMFRAMKTGDGVSVRQGRNARAWLSGKTGIDPAHVGLIGFCFGGGYALMAGAGWGAVSANYGHPPKATAMRGIGPVIACYGKRDSTLRKGPEELRALLAEVGQDDAEIHVFDAGHSFLTDGKVSLLGKLLPLGLGDYPDAREDGWRRILSFFDQRLR
ncbi:MAG TPA: dienelactone hydrolase family protein [Polyangiaceae bacterium]|jgi:carboxymethylenebutenolidase